MNRAIWIFLVLAGGPVWAVTDRIEIGGSARVRAEFRDNADFNQATKDYSDNIGSRLRIDAKFKANEKASLFFQPQFTKIWGEPEFVPTGAGANTAMNTSGATHDTGLDIHQGFLSYSTSEELSILLGRKELNYGDELLVGGVGWSHVGRSFDLVLAEYKHQWGRIDGFYSMVVDRNVSSAAAGDRDFSGLYFANRFSDYLSHADFYVFHLNDSGVNPKTSTTAYGLRLKSPVERFDYRVEATLENVKGVGSQDEHQFDVELGYTFLEAAKLRLAVEYFYATANFDQLFPTGHKWLGYADLFSRRNIKGYHARLSGQPTDSLTLALDYHVFERQETSQPAYKFNGTAYGTTGESSAIATEIDFVVAYKVDDNLTLEGGAARVQPEDYLKDNGGPDQAYFYYLQTTLMF